MIQVGTTFGRLTTISYAGKLRKRSAWLCRCTCGTEKVIQQSNLITGGTKSCGCLFVEQLIARNTTHGMDNTPEHISWENMKQRCLNPNHPDYPKYGKRGITVCVEWLEFKQFFADMGKCPPDHTLDRENNGLGYNKNNCRWATYKEQANNRR